MARERREAGSCAQRFDATWAERRLEQLERLHAPLAANKECEEKNGL